MQSYSFLYTFRILMFTFAVFPAFTPPQQARADEDFVRAVYGVGIGFGSTDAKGDFLAQQKGGYFGFAIELESGSWYFKYGGGSSTEEPPQHTFKDLTLVAGASWKYLIVGLGFRGIETVGPTTADIRFPFVTVATDLDTTFSVTGFGVLTRIRPLMTRNFTINLDGFYAFTTRGSMTVPVEILGMPGYIHSEPQKQGGLYGYAAELLWRLPVESYPLALKLSYQYNHAIMNPTSSGYQGDIFHLFGTATTPALEFENRSTMLSIVWVTR